ncbi:AGAMOUS-like 24 [Actinidia rufa]|uniref:AGAMOUS-like 24 n=1 Tax=Actinidia rufa TaxID=165716 RepID=A0A7J0GH47_9ERIC|nr:AGAMOUS-like 24 [Actinidia rufa]
MKLQQQTESETDARRAPTHRLIIGASNMSRPRAMRWSHVLPRTRGRTHALARVRREVPRLHAPGARHACTCDHAAVQSALHQCHVSKGIFWEYFFCLALSEISWHSGFIPEAGPTAFEFLARKLGDISGFSQQFSAEWEIDYEYGHDAVFYEEAQMREMGVLGEDNRGHSREVAFLGAFIATRKGISRGITQACEGLVQMANNTANKVVGKGTIWFRMADWRSMTLTEGNKEMLWGRKTGGLYRLEGSVQIGGATVLHGSSEVWLDTSSATSAGCAERSSEEGDKDDFEKLDERWSHNNLQSDVLCGAPPMRGVGYPVGVEGTSVRRCRHFGAEIYTLRMSDIIGKYSLHTNNIEQMDQPSLALQLEDSNLVKLGKDVSEKTTQLRQMRGEDLQGLNINELQHLEKMLEAGLSRVLETKGERIMNEIATLQRKGAELIEENQRLKQKMNAISEGKWAVTGVVGAESDNVVCRRTGPVVGIRHQCLQLQQCSTSRG